MLEIWDASSGACLHSLDLGVGSGVYKTIFSTDGSQLIVRSQRKDSIYDIHSGTPRLLKEQLGHSGRTINLDAIAMSPQEDCFVASSSGGAEIRSADTGKRLLALNAHTDTINSVAFSPGGSEGATASDDRTVAISDSWSGRRRRVHQMASAASSVAYSPKGDHLVVMCESSGKIRVCDAKSGAFIAELDGHTNTVRRLVLEIFVSF